MRYIDLPEFFSNNTWLSTICNDYYKDSIIVLTLTKEQLIQELAALEEQGYIKDIILQGKVQNLVDYPDKFHTQDVIEVMKRINKRFAYKSMWIDKNENIVFFDADLSGWNITNEENGNLEITSYDPIDNVMNLIIV